MSVALDANSTPDKEQVNITFDVAVEKLSQPQSEKQQNCLEAVPIANERMLFICNFLTVTC